MEDSNVVAIDEEWNGVWGESDVEQIQFTSKEATKMLEDGVLPVGSTIVGSIAFEQMDELVIPCSTYLIGSLQITGVKHVVFEDGLDITGNVWVTDSHVDGWPEDAVIEGSLYLERVNELAIPESMSVQEKIEHVAEYDPTAEEDVEPMDERMYGYQLFSDIAASRGLRGQQIQDAWDYDSY